MRLLLDTHIMLWALVADRRLPAKAVELISDVDNDIFVSAASIWEISIKYVLSRGAASDMPISGGQAREYCRAAGYHFLAVTADHASKVGDLPMLHRDPFDRILVTRAKLEPMRLLTHDSSLQAYDDTIITV